MQENTIHVNKIKFITKRCVQVQEISVKKKAILLNASLLVWHVKEWHFAFLFTTSNATFVVRKGRLFYRRIKGGKDRC